MSSSERTPLLKDGTASERHYRSDPISSEAFGNDTVTRDASTINVGQPSESSSAMAGPWADVENGHSLAIKHTSGAPLRERLRIYLLSEVPSDDYLKAQLLFLTFSTGIIDATTFTNYGCFTTKQTGNSVFLALRAASHPYVVDQEERNIGISFICFVLGSLIFGHVGHLINQRRRVSLLASMALQTAFVYIAAALAYFVTDRDTWPTAPTIVGLLAFGAGGQIAISIHVGLQELNTTMVTGALIQLCTDRHILELKNTKRNRRLIFYACFLCGCFTGANITKHVSTSLAILLHAVLKTIACLSFLFNEGNEPETDGETQRRPRSPLFRIIWGD